MQRRRAADCVDSNIPVFANDKKGLAGEEASGKVLNVLAAKHTWFLGGSADLVHRKQTL